MSQLADRLAAALVNAGTDTVFGLPGGGPNLDLIGATSALGARFVLAHGETAAAIMASTYGLLRGVPTPVVVTRGPGAASATNGLAQATLDRFPLIAVIDTVPTASAQRVAHQRIDQRAMLTPVAKKSVTLSDHYTDAEIADLAATAHRWPYGGVHLDVDPNAQPHPVEQGEPARSPAAVAVAAVREAVEFLSGPRRPVIVVGMEAATIAHRSGDDGLASCIAAFGCPVLTTYQAIGLVPTEGSAWAGLFTNGALERPVLEAADVIITIGLDLVEPIPAPWDYDVPVIQLSSVPQTDDYLPVSVEITGDLAASVDALAGAVADLTQGWDWEPDAPRRFRRDARLRLGAGRGDTSTNGTFGPIELVAGLSATVPSDATVTVDAGAHFLAVMPNWPVTRPFGLLISNGLATMGFAVPAAIGAALARPNRPVVALTGDGGLSMVVAELETIARLGLPITVVVFNDSALSLIEIKQGPAHGGAEVVRYRPVDFASIAEASGLAASVVTSADELATVLEGADGYGGVGWAQPRLIDARIDPGAYPDLIAATRG